MADGDKAVKRQLVNVITKRPGKRERAISQWGQLDGLDPADWDGDLPESIREAIERLGRSLAKLAGEALESEVIEEPKVPEYGIDGKPVL